MSLIRVADGAYPHPPYTFLPEDVKVWAGYLGGHTPHSWTLAEITGARRLVGAWWGIWTSPDRRAIDARDGVADAAGTVARLVELDYPRTDPVFYDVEYTAYFASPSGARAAISAWKRGLAAAGYRNTFAYVPLAAGFDWLAHWTGIRPTSLPAGVVGIQYDHALFNDAYDISVFDTALLGLREGADMALTSADAQTLFDAEVTNPDGGVRQPFAQRLTETETAAKAAASGVARLSAAQAAQQQALDEIKTLLSQLTVPVAGTFTIQGQGTVGGP